MKNSSRMKKHVNTAMDMFPEKAALYAESRKSISKGTYKEAEEYERFLREKYDMEDPFELIKFVSPEEILYWEELLRHQANRAFCPPAV